MRASQHCQGYAHVSNDFLDFVFLVMVPSVLLQIAVHFGANLLEGTLHRLFKRAAMSAVLRRKLLFRRLEKTGGGLLHHAT